MKKALSIFLSICIILSCFSLGVTSASSTASTAIWDGTVAKSFASGSGTKYEPYIIETAEQLAYFAQSSLPFSDKYVKLANDIYLNDTTNWEDWETNPPANEWVPIEKNAGRFAGTFDGNNNTIYGVYCSDNVYSGLFYGGGTIKNVTVKDSYISATKWAGGISQSGATLINCHNYATVVSDEKAGGIVASSCVSGIYSCSNHGEIFGTNAGGIVGEINTSTNSLGTEVTISESYNTGNVTATNHAGGIVGSYHPYNCSSYNNLLTVYFSSTIVNCYNNGTINGAYAGGICGYLLDSKWIGYRDASSVDEVISHCYNVGIVNESDYSGQIMGYCGSLREEKSNIHATQRIDYVYYYNPVPIVQYAIGGSTEDKDCFCVLSKNFARHESNYSGFDFTSIWFIDNTCEYPYPMLRNNMQVHLHSYQTTEQAPTCTESGFKTTTCTSCGDTSTETFPALGHKLETVTVKPTCTENGESYLYCPGCETIFGEKTSISATGHTYTENIIKKSTCTEAGEKEFICSCNHSYTEVIPATGHKLNITVNSPTCTTPGYQYAVCENCGNMIGDTVILPATHSYKGEITKAPTCTETGIKAYTCICGDNYTETVPATGHTYSDWIIDTPAACTKDGIKHKDCQNCDDVITECISATGHSLKTLIVPPTCTEDGYTETTCSSCDYYIVSDRISAPGHSYEENITPPSVADQGYTTFTCKNCGNSYRDNYVNACGATISGTAVSFSADTEDVTIQLFKENEETASHSVTVSENIATYILESVEPGKYILSVSKENHITRTYEIIIIDENINLDIKIHLKGDLNGDGKVNTVDVARANSHAKDVSMLTDYEFACADIDNNKKVNAVDVARMNAHAKSVSTLW